MTGEDLAKLKVRRAIFHDVPNHGRFSAAAEPTLSEAETQLDVARQSHLRTRLVRVLGSKSAYPIVFKAGTGSPVPAEIRAFTSKHLSSDAFVAMSQAIAGYLFEQQNGAVSPGLLCVLDVAVAQRSAVVLMKLEREEGARLELIEKTGKKTFDMSVLDNLVLTDGTRLFKTAIFMRTGKGDDDFDSIACDGQLSPSSSDDMAQFWLRFLGGEFTVEPRVATKRFYEAALRFVNDVVTEPVQKNDVYEHLQSQLKTTKSQFSPKAFTEEFVPKEFRKLFQQHLETHGAPVAVFKKDLVDIEGRLRKSQYLTERGAVISVPIENAEIVEVTEDQIIVSDSLVSVDRR
jgi:hypothetical protein